MSQTSINQINTIYSIQNLEQERARPFKQAYLYFVKEREIVEYNSGKPEKTLRRIFS